MATFEVYIKGEHTGIILDAINEEEAFNQIKSMNIYKSKNIELQEI